MRDAVAEVLHERQNLDRNISNGLLLSLLLHAFLAVPFVLAARAADNPRPQPVRVRLAAPASSDLQSPATVPGTPAPEPQQQIPPPRPQPEPPRPVETPVPATKQVERSLFGESPETPVDRRAERDAPRAAPSRREPQEAVPATPAPPAGGASSGITVGAGSAQVSGLEGDFPYTFYVERMLGIIAQKWFRPDVGTGTSATIYFIIERSGQVRGVEIRQQSGNATFDRAARRAVIEASPLPPLPFQYSGTELGVHLKFN
jgi:TonB family protein